MKRFFDAVWDRGFWTFMMLLALCGWCLGGFVVISLFHLLFG